LIDQLKALNEATQAINSRVSLEQVLQTIVRAAQSLIKTRYAALGVHDGQGRLARFITVGVSEETRQQIGAFPLGRGLLGHLLQGERSLIVNDLANHPEAVGFPPHHPAMRQLLGVPIFAKGELLGAFYLTDKIDESDFTIDEQQLVEMLARHAAVAIENARLYEQNQQLAIVDERARFARDLHDSIIQSIYGVGLSLDQIKDHLPPDSDLGRRIVDLSLKSLAEVIDELRNYIFDLRPQALGHKDLETRLAGLIKEVKMNTHLPVEVEISPNLNKLLTEIQARHLFHIAHEALANVARHAKANKIWFSLQHQADEITLLVRDDGLGFLPPDEINPGHHGLANIRARAEQLGASCELKSEPGQGTSLRLSFRVNLRTG
jgi:signal transduction histidine kinase